MTWKFWKKTKWKPMVYEELTPEAQKKVDDVEQIIKDCGGIIKDRRIETDD